ncbi:hypothetical protein MKY89_11235 [Bacillus sp. FSL W7-1294]|uniref:hypothetical protein n=1 Tax=Bacillus TaxID=1386 RepID=UPI00077A93C2|nr:hypothetical protein [Bacillus cereus]KXY73124.1 hypothetical protein AT270_04205 [Bacillus cereus]
MEVDINVEECVNINTIKFGIGELKEISSSTVQKQLVQIEAFLQEFCMHQKQLSEKIKQSRKLSISSVSSGAKVPRSQINLNTNTLKFYIEKRIMEIEKKDILNIMKYERLKSEKRKLESYLNGLRQQIVDSFELKPRLEMLEAENKRLIIQIELRQKDVQKLTEENSKLRKALSDYNKKKIVPFN